MWDSTTILVSKTNMHITSAERCTGFYELQAGLQLFVSPEDKGHKYWHTFWNLLMEQEAQGSQRSYSSFLGKGSHIV